MNKSVITLAGLDILNNSIAGGDTTQYWIGYYGLAYVPDDLRAQGEPGELKRTTSALVPIVDGKPAGDELFNIFQGSMADTVAGFDEGDLDSAAGRLYKQCLYAENIESTYRYALLPDSDGNKINTLVTFAQDASDPSRYHLYHTYIGAGCCAAGMDSNEFTKADVIVNEYGIPLPAPLFYASSDNDSILNTEIVTMDMRNYDGHTDPTWSSSNDSTRTRDDDVIANLDVKKSISNFNRYHAPSSSEGYAVAYDPACRNMAKVTKYFPIEHYDIANIIHDGGLIQNIETGKSSTNLNQGNEDGGFDNAKVGAVKYKINLTIVDYMKKASNRIVESAYTNDSSNPVKMPPIGFKFNRIGLYAVPVTLHAFNVTASGNEKCGGNKVQIEVNGDEEPTLFAIIDTDTIEMSEDGLAKFTIDFSVNFQEDTALVNNPVIFYNLYENDSITWYKNQLLANASTSEAVTTLGVELNYLRNMIESMNNRGSECGIGDDEGIWAFKNHTHPYMKNLVDSVNVDFGAVRGIYTMPEYENYTVYLTAGKTIPDDTDPSALTDDQTVKVNAYLVGENSMVLGKNSLDAGKYDLNMSNYGVVGKSSNAVLLMGGIGKVDHKYNDNHLVVKHAENSFINVPYGEFKHICGSVWMNSASSVYAIGTVLHSVGIGHNDVVPYEDSNADIQAPSLHTLSRGSVNQSIIVGRNSMYTSLINSIIVGDGVNGSTQRVGSLNAFSDLDAEWMDWRNARTVSSADDLETKLFPSCTGSEYSLLSLGSSKLIDSNLRNVMSVGSNSEVSSNSRNCIMVGDHMNMSEAAYAPKMILTLDEFNERYGSGVAYDDNDPINECTSFKDLVVIGSGELRYQDGYQGTTVSTHSVRGVTLYITYNHSSHPHQWYLGETIGNDGSGTFGTNPYSYANLYSRSGNLKNMIMLGDYMDAGHGSFNSILMGDYTGSRKIVFKNSFMNFMGDETAYHTNQTESQSITMNNVIWIGSARTRSQIIELPVGSEIPNGYHGDSSIESMEYQDGQVCVRSQNTTGHLIAAAIDEAKVIEHDNAPCEYKDAFVFRGDNPAVYGHASWYGAMDCTKFADLNNSEGYTFKYNTLMQPVQSPMIYTGGLSLGGYGMNNCNFMLLKIGTSTTNQYGVKSDVGINKEPNIFVCDTNDISIAEFSNICRSDNPHGPWYFDSMIYHERVATGILSANNTSIIISIPLDEDIDEDSPITAYLHMPSSAILNAVVTKVSDHNYECSISEAQTEDYEMRLEYSSYKSGGRILYNVHNEAVFDGKDYTTDHFMIDSPYAGMVLMVQDKQELDGTLHVGLGTPKSSTIYGNQKFVSVSCQYIASNSSLQLRLSGSVTGNLNLYAHYDVSQSLNTTYPLEPSTFENFELYGDVYYTQSGNDIVAHYTNIKLYFDLDAGYMISMNYQQPSEHHNAEFEFSNNKVIGYGGVRQIPSYIYMKGAAAELFPTIVEPGIINDGNSVMITQDGNHNSFSVDTGAMYRITPVEWHGGYDNLITTYGIFDHIGIVYPCRVDELTGDSVKAEGVILE